MSFLDIALPMIERDIPVIPLRPKTKIAFINNWESLASTDVEQIKSWNAQFPDANGACVARAKLGGVIFLEVDSPEVIKRIESETGKKIPKTYKIRSSPGRGHIYLKSTEKSLAVGNISQNVVKFNDWSLRADRAYVVSPKSIHPVSGKPYEVVSDAPIAEMPDWLLWWCVSQKQEIQKTSLAISGPDIPRGSHDSTLTSIAGRLRFDGLEEEALTDALIEIAEKRCIDKGDDWQEMCRKISKSICRYAPPVINPVLIGGVPVGQSTTVLVAPTVSSTPVRIPDRVKGIVPYPSFPRWVFKDTSIYKGFVEPICEKNSRYPEFMFMPAMALLLNYLGAGRVSIEYKGNLQPSIYLALIGEKGRLIKSSSVEDSIKYFEQAGCVIDWTPTLKSSDAKSMVMTAGSPEGLGIEMVRLGCRNGILYYDELSTLTNKAGIDSSTLSSTLLGLYESAKFSNMIKAKKDIYSMAAGTYCMSLIVCSTDKNFTSTWSKLAGKSSGLDDRFFFLYQPQHLKPPIPFEFVDTKQGSTETRRLIDRALERHTYTIVDQTPLIKLSEKNNRQEIRAEKFALGFAVELERDEIDEDCLDRACALVKYEREVKRYLKLYDAYTREGAVQLEIKNALYKCQGGEMRMSDLKKALQSEKYGTSLWSQAFHGLVRAGAIYEQGQDTPEDPLRVILIEAPGEDD